MWLSSDKKYTFTGLLLLLSLFIQAQQDPMYSQYMYNMMSVNPAYAGSKGGIHALLLHRQQWTDIEGAPTTQNFTIHSPFMDDKMGLGLNVVNDKIGVSSRLDIQAAYAYKIQLSESNLRFGLQAGVTRWNNDWNDIQTLTANDPSFVNGSETILKPNFGFGAYWYSEKYFAGISVPHILNNSLNEDEGDAEQIRHMFLNGGALFTLNDQLKLKPSVLLKYVEAAPLQADFNLELVISDRVWTGVSARVWDGMVAMIQVNLKDHFWVGYAYDYPFTELRTVTNGSHEVFISYTHYIKRSKVVSPRYF